MMKFCSLCFYLVLTLFAVCANASCSDPNLNRLTLTLHPGKLLDNKLVECKQWPADPSLTIFVLPYPHPLPIEPETTVYDVEIAVVNNASGKVVANSYQTDAWESDANKIDHVQIDTGRYQLATAIRGFGVRIHTTGSSKANPFYGEQLSLYMIKNQRLINLLGITVNDFTGEWDTNCAGEFEEFNRILIVLPHKTNGFADLLVKETRAKKKSLSLSARNA
ncbi:hypothetical protein [Methylocucumis oryzae]|uniref:hypothetical protein n=1 Tax=Methylocucumis oryzae TaxID=1632867 RepID=UPI00103E3D6B|nr:hypothetical protein [Methylocucumis oryzae]